MISLFDKFTLFGTAIFEPFASPLSRTHWCGLLFFCLVGLVYGLIKKRDSGILQQIYSVMKHPSSLLDIQLLLGRQLLVVLLTAPTFFSAWWVSTHLVRWLDSFIGPPERLDWSEGAIALFYSLTLFVVWDLSRFIVHWAMHRFSFLWQFHQVHHSAEVLTPLTFHRIHPVESLIYTVRSVVVTGVLSGAFYWLFRDALSQIMLWGVPALGFFLNFLFGNFRHSHVWICFPNWLERWFISPAQHQLHHSAERAHYDSNYGTWLSIWDRICGSLLFSEKKPDSYGVQEAERNHDFNLLSAWFGPFRALLPVFFIAMFTFSGQALAEDESESSNTTDEVVDEDGAIVVYASDTRIIEAGAAYHIDESDLSTFEYNDVMRVLGRVPGVSTRSEDGFGLRPNIGIRGANSDRSAKLTLMEDGVLLAPAPYAAPAAYYFPMSTRFTGVEVFKGAASTRYGPQTVGGALNVRTRGIPDSFGMYTDVSVGLYNTYKGHAWAGGKGERVGGLIEGVHLQSDGFKELDTGGETGFQRSEFMFKGQVRPNVNSRVQLKLGYATEQSNETYLGLTASDIQETPYRRYAASEKGLMEWQRTQAELTYNTSLGANVFVRSVLYHHWLTRSWTKFNAFQNGPETHELLYTEPQSGQGAVFLDILRGEEDTGSDQRLLIGTNDRTFHSYGWQNTFIWEQGLNDSRLELGLRLHGDDVHRLHTEKPFDMSGGKLIATSDPTETTTDSQATATALAVYAYEDLQLRKLHLYPSVRLELVRSLLTGKDISEEDAILRQTFLPGFGALYEINTWSDVFVGTYRGFSPVSPGQSESVEPEYSLNSEAGIRVHESSRYVEAIAFFNDYKNLTGQCTISSGCDITEIDRQYNGGRVWIYGAESIGGIDIPLPKSISLPIDVSYTFTRSRFLSMFTSDFAQFGSVEVADSLPYVAEQQASFHSGLKHDRGGIQIGAVYRGAMLDSAGQFNNDELEIPALLLVDMAAQIRFYKNWEAYTTVQNLTQQTQEVSWRPFGARPTAPFQVMLGVKWQPTL